MTRRSRVRPQSPANKRFLTALTIGLIPAGALTGSWTLPDAPNPRSGNPASGTEQQGARISPVALDHVPIAVRDLESAHAHWQDDLGFTIKPGRVHDNTIENRHIKFADGSALELITATRPEDALAASYVEVLENGDGAAFLALAPEAFDALTEEVSGTGLRHDVVVGPYYRWLTFAQDPVLAFLFFSHVIPAVVDTPEQVRHLNGALRLGAVWIAGDRTAATRDLLAVLGFQVDGTVILPGGIVADRLRLDSGELYLSRTAAGSGHPVSGVTIIVSSLTAPLGAIRIGDDMTLAGADERGRFIRVPPDHANGVWLEFLEPARTGAEGPAPTHWTAEDDKA